MQRYILIFEKKREERTSFSISLSFGGEEENTPCANMLLFLDDDRVSPG